MRLRRGGTRGSDSLFGDRQWPSILLELIWLISLLAGESGVRSGLRFWSGLGVLRERSLSSGELVHDVLNRLPLGIAPDLVRSERWTDLRDWLFLDLGLIGRRTRGASQNVKWSRKLEQRFANRRFRALLLPLGASRLGDLFGRLVYLREIILIYLRSRGLFLRWGRRDGRRRGRNSHRRGLRERRRWFREVGNRSGAEVRKVRNGLKTIGNGSQD